MKKKSISQPITKIANILESTQERAETYCRLVQQRLSSYAISLSEIADFLEKHPELKTPVYFVDAYQKQLRTVKVTRPTSSPARNTDETSSTTTLQVLAPGSSIKSFIQNTTSKVVYIVSAFASHTEDVVQRVLQNKNHLTLIVGTINHFTDPAFIQECEVLTRKYPQTFQFFVDFRSNESIHWKLYLLSPNETIIGSPNFTSTGLSMKRDLAVSIKDFSLFYLYRDLIKKLELESLVLAPQNPNFTQLFEQYKKEYRRNFNTNQPKEMTTHSGNQANSNYIQWATEEQSVILPIFLWEGQVTKAQEALFKRKVEPSIKREDIQGMNALELLGVCVESHDKEPYNNGDIILFIECNGNSIYFSRVDIVVFAENNWWLCKFYNTKFKQPFELTDSFLSAVSKKIESWVEINKTYLDSREIRDLALNIKEK